MSGQVSLRMNGMAYRPGHLGHNRQTSTVVLRNAGMTEAQIIGIKRYNDKAAREKLTR